MEGITIGNTLPKDIAAMNENLDREWQLVKDLNVYLEKYSVALHDTISEQANTYLRDIVKLVIKLKEELNDKTEKHSEAWDILHELEKGGLSL